ncbi:MULTISPECIES: hypothetical protein [Actinomycetes]|uniref:hypothetical protein n=1 Tax=Actinomycetes TaxID=1760 RepID=UPI0004C10F64|nr:MULTISPECIES: hypothetical protein [Actinomycetes]
MTTAQAISTASVLIWLGMVLAISFLEAPLKFRAPGVDLKTGLGSGIVLTPTAGREESWTRT